MYNKKVLSNILAKLDNAKAPAKSKDIITDPMGQWKYPGQNTRIPGNDITMQGVSYPVMAQPNIGQPQMMYPGQDYQFPGADYVDEYPMAKRGGAMPKLPKKKNSKSYSKSLTATNKLFAQNSLTKKNKSKKNKIFDPSSKYYQKGGATTPEEWGQEIKTIERQIGNPKKWTLESYNLLQNKLYDYKNWRENTPEGQTVIDSHNVAGEYDIPVPEHLSGIPYNTSGPQNFQKGGFQDDINKRRQVLRDWTYGADIGMLQEANGGYIDAELTPEEIEWYRSQGYQVEDMD